MAFKKKNEDGKEETNEEYPSAEVETAKAPSEDDAILVPAQDPDEMVGIIPRILTNGGVLNCTIGGREYNLVNGKKCSVTRDARDQLQSRGLL